MMEEDNFKKSHVDFKKLESYGFLKEEKEYKYTRNFFNDKFRAVITIDDKGIIKGKVIDLQMMEEYTNIRVKSLKGEFVSRVREEYINILKDIQDNCFIKEYFRGRQANEVVRYVHDKYGVDIAFLWDNLPDCGVFKNKVNDKWFGIIMSINKNKLDKEDKEVEIINVKINKLDKLKLLSIKGIYLAYHMNKDSWITITLDDTINDKEIFKLIDDSYNLINKKEEWIVPANQKYYDVLNAFLNTQEITWKQSSDIKVNDIVYLYVAAPYSSILYKCVAEDVNIPYQYEDKNLKINKVMKLKLIERYKEGEISFAKLNDLGIKAIRGPRKIDKSISDKFLK